MNDERTDHVALSEARLEESEDLRSMGEFAHADLKAKQSQVHATLAMVERQDRLIEQQRIANLIALAGLPTREGPVSDYADELRNDALATLAHYESRQPDYEAIKIDPDIASALGIQDGA